MTAIAVADCERLRGGSVVNCACRLLPHDRLRGGGFLECPPEARGIIVDLGIDLASPALRAVLNGFAPTGDICSSCGSPNMTRAGTCLLCRDCGDTSGGCS